VRADTYGRKGLIGYRVKKDVTKVQVYLLVYIDNQSSFF